MAIPKLKNIVCIDDEPDILELISLTLQTVGEYKVSAFLSSVSALNSIDVLDVDLIIIDGMMPEISGMEALIEIRKKPQFEKTPVIFMTARVQPKEQQEYLDLGAISVISKPFDPMALPEQIQNLWEEHHTS